MAITTIDDLVAAIASLSARQRINFMKIMTAAKGAGLYQSSWQSTGRPGAGAVSPVHTAGSGYTCDRTTTGAMTYTNGSTQNYLARLLATSSVAGTIMICDRLWSCSNTVATAATYTVTTPGNLPARITDSGVDCELWHEQFTTGGANVGTFSAVYVNTTPTGGRAATSGAVSTTPTLGQMQQMALQVGDLGISQLTSFTNTSTVTSGTWGFTILKRHLEIPVTVAGIATLVDWAATGLGRIPSDACLMMMMHASATTAATVLGTIDIIDK